MATIATMQKNAFQLTPPIRVATNNVSEAMIKAIISTHATHKGGDDIPEDFATDILDFNSRHP